MPATGVAQLQSAHDVGQRSQFRALVSSSTSICTVSPASRNWRDLARDDAAEGMPADEIRSVRSNAPDVRHVAACPTFDRPVRAGARRSTPLRLDAEDPRFASSRARAQAERVSLTAGDAEERRRVGCAASGARPSWTPANPRAMASSSAAAVGNSRRPETDRSTPNSSAMAATTSVASSESPPRSKKSSWTPISAGVRSSTSAKSSTSRHCRGVLEPRTASRARWHRARRRRAPHDRPFPRSSQRNHTREYEAVGIE